MRRSWVLGYAVTTLAGVAAIGGICLAAQSPGHPELRAPARVAAAPNTSVAPKPVQLLPVPPAPAPELIAETLPAPEPVAPTRSYGSANTHRTAPTRTAPTPAPQRTTTDAPTSAPAPPPETSEPEPTPPEEPTPALDPAHLVGGVLRALPR